MAHIIDFQKHLMKKTLKNDVLRDEVEFEIALTVAKYIYAYMQEKFDDPLDVITFNASTSQLFKGERNRFTAALLEIFEYWEIDITEENVELFDNEFELFPTVEEICSFLERRVV